MAKSSLNRSNHAKPRFKHPCFQHLEDRHFLAADYELVAILNESLVPLVNGPKHYAEVNGGVVFEGASAAQGAELWFSNLETGGTRLIKDITPGLRSTPFFDIASVGSRALISVLEEVTSNQNRFVYYVTDGTSEGTRQIVYEGRDDSVRGGKITILGDKAYFISDGELFSINVVEGIATPVGNANREFTPLPDQSLIGLNGRLYFVGGDVFSSSEGSKKQIMVLDSRDALGVPQVLVETSASNYLELVGGDNDLWYKEISNFGVDISNPKFGPLTYGQLFSSIDLTSRLVTPQFIVRTFGRIEAKIVGDNLWYLDSGSISKSTAGTQGASVVIADDKFQRFNDLIVLHFGEKFFVAVRSRTASQTFISDGTSNGTFQLPSSLAQIARYSFDFSSSHLPPAVQSINGEIFYLGTLEDFDITGPPPPLVMLNRLKPGQTEPTIVHQFESSSRTNVIGELGFMGELGVVGDKVLYSELNERAVDRLMAFDLSDENKIAYVTPDPKIRSANETYGILGTRGSLTYIFSQSFTAPSKYWVTDGTSAGTRELTAIEGDQAKALFVPFVTFGGFDYLTDARGIVLRRDSNGVTSKVNFQLTDGTEASIVDAVALGGRLYLSVSVSVPGGSLRLFSIEESNPSPQEIEIESTNGFMRPFEFRGNAYVWTLEDVRLKRVSLLKINPETGSTTTQLTVPPELLNVNSSEPLGDFIYFVASNPLTNSHEVWRTDGTLEGLQKRASLNFEFSMRSPALVRGPVGKLLVVPGNGSQSALWTIDGYTWAIDEYNGELAPISNSFQNTITGAKSTNLYLPSPVATDQGRVLGTGLNAALGEEYWISNGTANGTLNLAELIPGSGSAFGFDGELFNGVSLRDDGTLIVLSNRINATPGTELGTGMSIWKLDTRATTLPVDSTVFLVFENSSPGTYVGRIELANVAPGVNTSYSVAAGLPFSVDASSGEIRVSSDARLDFETKDKFTFDVSVQYRDMISGLPTNRTVSIAVNLIDQNDPPQVVSINGVRYDQAIVIQIPEDAKFGSYVGRIVASDVDPGLQWFFAQVEGSLSVRVDDNGFLHVGTFDLNYESLSSFSIFVRLVSSPDRRVVEDPLRYRTLELRFGLVDVNEEPAGFGTVVNRPALIPGQNVKIQALANVPTDPEGGTVTMVATMPNGDPLPNWITYSPETNEFLVAPWNDDAGNHDIKITATDPTGLESSMVISLSVQSVAAIWQNPLDQADVDGDGRVRPIDALRIINYLARKLPNDIDPRTRQRTLYFDVTGDNRITTLDALRVINAIARQRFTSNVSPGSTTGAQSGTTMSLQTGTSNVLAGTFTGSASSTSINNSLPNASPLILPGSVLDKLKPTLSSTIIINSGTLA